MKSFKRLKEDYPYLKHVCGKDRREDPIGLPFRILEAQILTDCPEEDTTAAHIFVQFATPLREDDIYGGCFTSTLMIPWLEYDAVQTEKALDDLINAGAIIYDRKAFIGKFIGALKEHIKDFDAGTSKEAAKQYRKEAKEANRQKELAAETADEDKDSEWWKETEAEFGKEIVQAIKTSPEYEAHKEAYKAYSKAEDDQWDAEVALEASPEWNAWNKAKAELEKDKENEFYKSELEKAERALHASELYIVWKKADEAADAAEAVWTQAYDELEELQESYGISNY